MFTWKNLRVDDKATAGIPQIYHGSFYDHHGRLDARSGGYGASYFNLDVPTDTTGKLAIGQHVIKADVSFDLYSADDVPLPNGSPAKPIEAAALLQTFKMEIQTNFEVCETGKTPPIAVNDESLRAAIIKSIKAKPIILQQKIQLEIAYTMPPIRLLFNVRAKGVGGHEDDLGVQEGSTNSNDSYQSSPLSITPNEPFDLVFTPAIEAARKQVVTTPIWGGSLVIHHDAAVPTTSPAANH